MSDRPRKRSITLHGHRTSVSLEDVFWQELQRIAAAKNASLNAIIMRVDDKRDPEVGLATAIRLYVVNTLRAERDSAP